MGNRKENWNPFKVIGGPNYTGLNSIADSSEFYGLYSVFLFILNVYEFILNVRFFEMFKFGSFCKILKENPGFSQIIFEWVFSISGQVQAVQMLQN